MTNEYLNNKKFESIISKFQQCQREKNKYHMLLEELKDSQQRKDIRKASKKREETALVKIESSYLDYCNQFTDAQKDLALAFYTLSQNIVGYAKFNLIDVDDAVQEGVMICFQKVDRFDPVKGKAFNYMTTCILNHFRQLYRTARSYNEFKKKYGDHQQAKENKNFIKNGKLHLLMKY